MDERRLFGLRGAIRCQNTPCDIEGRVAELYDVILSRNRLDEKDIVSMIFSVTSDLDSLNPAAALRKSGRGDSLSLFCAVEPAVVGGLAGVIRVLLHAYLPADQSPQHPYLNGAEALRPDRSS